MSTLCLINPKAGKKRIDDITSLLKNQNTWTNLKFYTLKPHEIDTPPWKESLSQYERVIICGGDGTLHHVIQHFIYSDIELVFIPTGTANDLCFNIGFKGNFKTYIEELIQGKTIAYDTIEMNGQHILTGGGFGLGCEVAEFCNTLKSWKFGSLIKKVLGKNIYPLTLFSMGLMNSLKALQVTISRENKQTHFSTFAILIANQEYMGRDVKIAPGTQNGDGLFQHIHFNHKSTLGVIYSLLKIKLSKTVSPRQLFREEIETLQLSFEKPVKAYGDGEIFEPSSEWLIKCHKASLNIRIPG